MNIPSYLRKLDDEIRAHRQQIALHQVEIARLEDARRVIIGLEERPPEHSAPGTLPIAEAEKPLLIVRQAATSVDERLDDARATRKKERDAANYQKRKERMRRLRSDAGVKKGATPEVRASVEARRQRVLSAFKSSSVLMPFEVVEELGLTGADKASVYNDLATLKERGLLRQSDVGEPYTLVPHANGEAR